MFLILNLMVTMLNNKIFGSGSIKSALGLLIVVIFPQFASAEATTNNPHDLPPSKVELGHCQQEALALHAGIIEQERVFHQQGGSWVRYDIQSPDNTEWSVLCDLATGKIINEQRRIGDKP
jgi:hypothetical protein